jgi:hypothetical protein
MHIGVNISLDDVWQNLRCHPFVSSGRVHRESTLETSQLFLDD